MVRTPVVADRFYPGDASRLRGEVEQFISTVDVESRQPALAVIVPHAGYIYSGATAGETFGRVEVPQAAVMLGPNHHGRGAAVALGTNDWLMPMGEVPVEQELAAAILHRSDLIRNDELAHDYEHSLEVQVPFLQYLQEDLSIVPITISHISYTQCEQVAGSLSAAIQAYDKPTLLVASTDMTHYESRQQATVKDNLAIDHIRSLDPKGLYETVIGNRISMCGIIPTTIVLLTALNLGASLAELVRYTDSGATSGDLDQVVGYAGLIIS